MVETLVKERGIIMAGDSVRAILDGRKTQTRRVVKPQPTSPAVLDDVSARCEEATGYPLEDRRPYCMWVGERDGKTWIDQGVRCPYGATGDRLWVREAFFDHGNYGIDALDSIPTPRDERIEYRAEPWDRLGDPKEAGPWTSPIHMPRWASRLTLEITDVRVERLLSITNEDAIAEGCVGGPELEGYSEQNPADPYEEYAIRWDAINGKRAPWDSNPWVWVLTFKPL